MKKILIVFPDFFLPYSPTTLNIYEALRPYFDVTIMTFEPDARFSTQRITDKKVVYLKRNKLRFGKLLIQKIIQTIKVSFRLSKKDVTPIPLNAGTLAHEIKKFDGEIIAVDFFALWCVQQAGKKAHLVSLEIYDNDFYRDKCKMETIRSVIIQSEARYKRIFGETKLLTFYVQNSPIYIDMDLNPGRQKNELLFCGSAMPGFGIFTCLEFISDFPEYTLTIKGAVPVKTRESIEENYSNLLREKRLIINDDYLSPAELNKFVSGFRIGFVFYDYFRFEHINTFNYKTAPSGKLFQYYNAGIPVIANSIPGMSTIKEHKAGVMIDTMGSVAIKKAIDEIEEEYETYARNAKRLSKSLDFNTLIAPFIEFIRKENKDIA
jgi:glycosyltransferase involved in cell wall biosynthesis